MTKIISLFNHKGGVSKTTTTYHLGWKMATMGKKVLMVDADPQCNLTGLTLGIEDYDALNAFYDSKKNTDIFNSLMPVFEIETKTANTASSVPVTPTKNPNLFLLAGHIRFAEIDTQIATAITSSETIPVLRKFIGGINELLRRIAKENSFDVVLVDMSPSVSATNTCILMSSDYFIIPTSPDFYCYQAMDSLSKVLPEWSRKIAPFRRGSGDYVLPKENPKMLGFISQNYRVYTTRKDTDQKSMTKGYQKWLDKIMEVTNNTLIPALRSVPEGEMIISEADFKNAVSYDQPYHLASIQDFNSLLPTSQDVSKPIFELTSEDGKWQGSVWEKTDNNGKQQGVKMNIQEANEIYDNFAESVLKMIGCYEPIADKGVFDNIVDKAISTPAS